MCAFRKVLIPVISYNLWFRIRMSGRWGELPFQVGGNHKSSKPTAERTAIMAGEEDAAAALADSINQGTVHIVSFALCSTCCRLERFLARIIHCGSSCSMVNRATLPRSGAQVSAAAAPGNAARVAASEAAGGSAIRWYVTARQALSFGPCGSLIRRLVCLTVSRGAGAYAG